MKLNTLAIVAMIAATPANAYTFTGHASAFTSSLAGSTYNTRAAALGRMTAEGRRKAIRAGDYIGAFSGINGLGTSNNCTRSCN